MPTITLRDGDFGAGGIVTVGGDELFLPDPQHPGVTVPVPLAAVAEIDSMESDRSDQYKKALKLGARGFVTAGPVGLAMGVFAATKAKNVVFKSVLDDGRQFVAVTDAKTFAELHSAQLAARVARFKGDADSPADQVIAKYIEAREPESQIAHPEPPKAVAAPPTEHRIGRESTPRPVFGRRRSNH